MKRVVIVGGGFGGLHLVRRLERALRRGEADVTIVDRVNYSLFTPLLYQVATGELPPHAVAFPIRQATARAGHRFLLSEVEAIDTEARVVRTADGDVPYDHVVVAAGSVTTTYGVPGADRFALPMKDLADAGRVRKSILQSFERAAVETDPVRRRAHLTFVIVGGGPVGVELASSLRDLMDHSIQPMYPRLDLSRDAAIVLIDGAARIISGMDRRLSAIATRRLERQRITVLSRTFVAEVQEGSARTQAGARFDGRTIVWAGGVTTNPLVARMDAAHAADGRLLVDRSFRAGGRDDVLALGDAAYFEQDGAPLPQLAQVAVLQAPALAANLARLLRGQAPVPYTHHPKGDLIALGRTSAGAQIGNLFGIPMGNVVIGGFPAWTVWRINYLTQLLGVRNRASLLMEWLLSYFFSRMAADTP